MLITPPDIAITIILGFFTFNGFRHGFIEEMGRLISLVGGFIIASKFHALLLPHLQPYFKTETLRIAIAYLAIFMVSIITISIITKLLQKFIELVLLGWLNRLLGLLLGLLKGFLIVSLIIFIIQAIPIELGEGETIRKKLEKESLMYQICDHVKELIILTVPMDNHFNFLEDGLIKNSNEESILKNLQSPLP